MIRRWTTLAILIMVALPSVLYGRWINDKTYLQTDSVGKVEFSHFNHLEQKSIGRNCQTCHNDPFHIVSKNNPTATMADMKDGKSCGVCHNGRKAFGVGGDCTTCHAADVEISFGKTSHVVFSHDVHTGMFGCDDCHPDLFVAERNSNRVGMKQMEAGESCGSCHDGATAFGVKDDCGNCHQNADEVAMQSTVGAIAFSHDVHTGMFGCGDCHSDIFIAKADSNKVGMKQMEAGESCGACHDGATAFGVKGDCGTCHQGGAKDVAINSSAGEITFSHEIHTGMFGCGECHPDIFKAKANSNKVGMKKMEAGESCGACHDGDTAFAVSGDCTTCHTRAVDLQIQAKSVDAVPFSHEIHTGMFGCGECHPDIFTAKANSNQVGMQKMAEGASCGACHDGNTAFNVSEDCTACHTGKLSYTKDVAMKSSIWTIVFSHKLHTDMFNCSECHNKVFRPKANSNQVGMKRMEAGESCGACHNGDAAFSVSGDCTTCHNNSQNVAMQTKGIGTVPFSHAVHAKMFGCDDCHPGTFKTVANNNQVGMKKMEAGESCGACHDGVTAFGVKDDCSTCHIGAVNIPMQSSVGDIVFSHEVHTGMFGCGECHPDVFQAKANSNKAGMKKMEAGASCGTCHDGDTAFGVKGDCTTCHKNATDVAIHTKNVGVVSFSHAVHTEMYECGECHPTLFKAKANSNPVGMKKMETGASCGACHNGAIAFGVKEDCTSCHAGDIEYKSFGKIVFSHANHTEMLECAECHPQPFNARVGTNKVATMADMKEGKSCGFCHNEEKAFGVGKCDPCHQR